MTNGKIASATNTLSDVNQLLVTATAIIPVFGGLISSIVAIAARHKADATKIQTLVDGIARMTAELDKLSANDAAWRAEHPTV